MLVNSTGLGKTTLTCHVTNFKQVKIDDRKYFQMVVESTIPVRWHITINMNGSDLRQVIWHSLKNVFLIPKIVWHLAFNYK